MWMRGNACRELVVLNLHPRPETEYSTYLRFVQASTAVSFKRQRFEIGAGEVGGRSISIYSWWFSAMSTKLRSLGQLLAALAAKDR